MTDHRNDVQADESIRRQDMILAFKDSMDEAADLIEEGATLMHDNLATNDIITMALLKIMEAQTKQADALLQLFKLEVFR